MTILLKTKLPEDAMSSPIHLMSEIREYIAVKMINKKLILVSESDEDKSMPYEEFVIELLILLLFGYTFMYYPDQQFVERFILNPYYNV